MERSKFPPIDVIFGIESDEPKDTSIEDVLLCVAAGTGGACAEEGEVAVRYVPEPGHCATCKHFLPSRFCGDESAMCALLSIRRKFDGSGFCEQHEAKV